MAEWIPVSRELPKKTGLYLISIGDLVSTESFDGHNFRTQAMIRFVPDAWMPLPEPYDETKDHCSPKCTDYDYCEYCDFANVCENCKA